MKKVLKWVGIVFLGLVVLGFIFGDDEDTTMNESTEPETEAVQVDASEEQQEDTKSNEEVEEEPVTEEEDPEETVVEEEQPEQPEEEKEEPKEPEEPSLTLSQQNAIGAAESYLNYTAFSKSGLVEQLEFEGFSKEDATFAVENIKVDWKEQAVKSGENYLDFSSFSRTGLIEQLEFEGFTTEQATYAVDQIGL